MKKVKIVKFLDLFNFLTFKLSKLTSGLREFKITNEMSDFSNKEITLLLRKSVSLDE